MATGTVFCNCEKGPERLRVRPHSYAVKKVWDRQAAPLIR